MRIKNKMAVAVVVALGTSVAQANVIYDWQPESNTDVLATTGGRFVISDATYQSGAVDASYDAYYLSVPEDFNFPDSSIIETSLNVESTGALESDTVAAYPRQGYGQGSPNPLFYDLVVDMTFAGDSLLGSLDLTNTSNDVHMASDDDGLWTISRYDTDADIGGPCGDGGGCGGATGRWVLDGASVPSNNVPEPSSWVLFGLGLIGLAGAYRSRRA